MKLGEKFQLKKFVGVQELNNSGYSNLENIEWMLNTRIFTAKRIDKENKRIYFYNDLFKRDCFLDEKICESLNSEPRGHRLTKMFRSESRVDVKI